MLPLTGKYGTEQFLLRLAEVADSSRTLQCLMTVPPRTDHLAIARNKYKSCFNRKISVSCAYSKNK